MTLSVAIDKCAHSKVTPRRTTCIVLLMVMGLVACAYRPKVADGIRTQLQSGATQVDFGQMAGPEWDRMFVFGPYTPKTDVCSTPKLSEGQCSAGGFDDYVDEGEHLLVFMKGQDVARVERVRRFVEFDTPCLSKEFPKAEARFRVEQKDRPVLTCPH